MAIYQHWSLSGSGAMHWECVRYKEMKRKEEEKGEAALRWEGKTAGLSKIQNITVLNTEVAETFITTYMMTVSQLNRRKYSSR